MDFRKKGRDKESFRRTEPQSLQTSDVIPPTQESRKSKDLPRVFNSGSVLRPSFSKTKRSENIASFGNSQKESSAPHPETVRFQSDPSTQQTPGVTVKPHFKAKSTNALLKPWQESPASSQDTRRATVKPIFKNIPSSNGRTSVTDGICGSPIKTTCLKASPMYQASSHKATVKPTFKATPNSNSVISVTGSSAFSQGTPDKNSSGFSEKPSSALEPSGEIPKFKSSKPVLAKTSLEPEGFSLKSKLAEKNKAFKESCKYSPFTKLTGNF